jgi:hypothetical protein
MLKLFSSCMPSAAPELERFQVAVWRRAVELEICPALSVVKNHVILLRPPLVREVKLLGSFSKDH